MFFIQDTLFNWDYNQKASIIWDAIILFVQIICHFLLLFYFLTIRKYMFILCYVFHFLQLFEMTDNTYIASFMLFEKNIFRYIKAQLTLLFLYVSIFNTFYYPCWITSNNTICRNIFSYHRVGSNNSSISYSYTWQNCCLIAYPYIITYYDWTF